MYRLYYETYILGAAVMKSSQLGYSVIKWRG